jgi:hypothetical protein
VISFCRPSLGDLFLGGAAFMPAFPAGLDSVNANGVVRATASEAFDYVIPIGWMQFGIWKVRHDAWTNVWAQWASTCCPVRITCVDPKCLTAKSAAIYNFSH